MSLHYTVYRKHIGGPTARRADRDLGVQDVFAAGCISAAEVNAGSSVDARAYHMAGGARSWLMSSKGCWALVLFSAVWLCGPLFARCLIAAVALACAGSDFGGQAVPGDNRAGTSGTLQSAHKTQDTRKTPDTNITSTFTPLSSLGRPIPAQPHTASTSRR
jgi:hypothetical protein